MADRKDIPPAPRLCRNSVHGSTGSPRTDGDTPKFKDSAVRSFDELLCGCQVTNTRVLLFL